MPAPNAKSHLINFTTRCFEIAPPNPQYRPRPVCKQTKANWSSQSLFYRFGDKLWSQGRAFLLENCAVGAFTPDYRTVPRIFANAIYTVSVIRVKKAREMSVSHKFHPRPSWNSRLFSSRQPAARRRRAGCLRFAQLPRRSPRPRVLWISRV